MTHYYRIRFIFLVLFLFAVTSATAAGAGPDITSMTPASGSTLSSASETFDWNDVPNTISYWLYVGTTQGTSNIYNSGVARTISEEMVSNLPTNGSTIYLTVWYKLASSANIAGRTNCVSNGWCQQYFTYTAFTA